MDKRRGHGMAHTEKAPGATLARVFPGWVITGKRRKLHPSDRRKPDPAAFAHATHLAATHPPILSCTMVVRLLAPRLDKEGLGEVTLSTYMLHTLRT